MKNYIAILLVILLTGCSSTVFESLPGKNISHCDNRLVGNWKVYSLDKEGKIEEDENDKDESHIRIGKDCKEIEFFKNGKRDEEVQEMNKGKIATFFASIDKKDILAIKPKEDGNQKSDRDGYIYFLYKIENEGIYFFDTDHDYIAKLIKQGDLKGKVEEVGEKIRHTENFVVGNERKMTKILKEFRLFEKVPEVMLKRVDNIPLSSEKSNHESE